ncbi:MAG: YIP1 family protein [Candidatus Dadabacteria bacterium]|nr:YIP1 family protein [Candidatus Dadabacteria bacterium]
MFICADGGAPESFTFLSSAEVALQVFIKRLIRALLLDPAVYEEIEHDKRAMWQAALVVLLSSLSRGLYAYNVGNYEGLVIGTITNFVLWILLSFLIYIIGTKLFPESETRSDQWEVMRVLGFASAPGIFRGFASTPHMTAIVFLVVWVWTLAAMIVAVRQALDFRSTWNAIWVCVVGLITYWLFYVILFFAFGLPKPAWS